MKRFIFGAGKCARSVIADSVLSRNDKFEGIVVSSLYGNVSVLYDLQVFELEEVLNTYGNSIEVVLGVSDRYKNEVKTLLKNSGITEIIDWREKELCYKDYSSISEREYLSLWYFAVTGKVLDWNNLVSYNEKIQWIKVFDCSKKKKRLADKFLVRDYILNRIGNEYLIPLLGVWEKFDDIGFSVLPDSFVLKCNHGSGWNEIINDKNNIDTHSMGAKFTTWLNTDYADTPGLELQYKDIKPLIIAEELLDDLSGEIPDYKFFVFNGKVRLIQVDITRATNHRRNIYTPSWEYLPVSIHYPSAPDMIIERPQCLEKMILIAEELGKEFIHVRVDLYLVNGKIYFGEMTFTHGNGIEVFDPEKFGIEMGNWIRLPQ